MRPLEILVLYVIIGACVGLSQHRSGRSGALLSVPFWPLFLPAMLGDHPTDHAAAWRAATGATGGWRVRIEGATEALAKALGGPNGGQEGMETQRSLHHLNVKLFELAEKLSQLDQVLYSPEHAPEALERALQAAPLSARPMVEARLQNVARLRALHAERQGELEQALAILGDLATRAYLARFTGDAAETVADELRKLTAAVDTGGELAQLTGAARGR